MIEFNQKNLNTLDFPLVSICIPTYNGAKYLQKALDSILTQDYPNLEVIISDDQSKDQTWQIAQKFKKSVSFPVYILAHKPNGIGSNWNNCIRNAHGAYIKFLFQDDLLLPSCITELVNIIKKDISIGLVACQRAFIDANGNNKTLGSNESAQFNFLQVQYNSEPIDMVFDVSYFKNNLFFKSPLNKFGEPSTTLIRKSAIDNVGLFREDLKQVLDYEFCYRLLADKYKIYITASQLVLFRIHENQATNINKNESIDDYNKMKNILLKDYFFKLSLKYRWYLLKYKFSQTRLFITLLNIKNRYFNQSETNKIK